MIQETELRIGNWVIWNEDETFMQIGPTSFLLPDERFNPIPLTPEILEQCGIQNNKIPLRNGNWLVIPELKWVDIQKDENLTLRVRCEFLHQLQNLYFALTGTELEVKQLTTA